MFTVQTSFGPVALDDAGEGRPVLLLHPSPGCRRDFDAIVPGLAAERRVIRLDWPGYGDTPAPEVPVTASLLAALLLEVIDGLDLRDLVLVGNSVGGFAAATAALALPERVAALVLVAPGGFTPKTPLTDLVCWVVGSSLVGRHALRWLPRWYLRVPTEWTRAIQERCAGFADDPHTVAVFRSLWRSFPDREHDLTEQVRLLTQPTLLMWGRRDPILWWLLDGRRAIRALPPDTPVVTLACGHQPYAECPEAFLDAVSTFLAEVDQVPQACAGPDPAEDAARV